MTQGNRYPVLIIFVALWFSGCDSEPALEVVAEREAEQAFGRALELNPNDTDVISAYAYFKWDTAQDEVSD